MIQDAKKVPDCKICMVPHDDEIHAATLNIREWFFNEVTKHFEDEEAYIIYQEADQAITAA